MCRFPNSNKVVGRFYHQPKSLYCYYYYYFFFARVNFKRSRSKNKNIIKNNIGTYIVYLWMKIIVQIIVFE